MTKIVLIGDVSWNSNYHLGDEAMTEVAIQQLSRRGAEVVLIAGNPELSSEYYQVQAVHRLGFRGIQQRDDRDSLLRQLTEAVTTNSFETLNSKTRQSVQEVISSDAIVIAGGGNLNSGGIHHIYERVALKRIAEVRNIPLYVTSQTVGPHLLPEDLELVRELVEYATVFGVRESGSQHFLRQEIGDAPTVLTMDDAILLDPTSREELTLPIILPRRFVIGSFTMHSWSTDLSRSKYYHNVARILDDIANQCDAQVLLVPHMGTLRAPNEPVDDVFGHQEIVRLSSSGRVTSLPMMRASDVLAMTEHALFTISTRYHPLVFSGRTSTPAIGLVTSYYSSIRMRGALRNLGLESLAVPLEHWNSEIGEEILQMVSSNQHVIRDHLLGIQAQVLDFQRAWWDYLYADILGTSDGRAPEFPQFEHPTVLSGNLVKSLSYVRSSSERVNLLRLESSLRERLFTEERERLQLQIGELRAEISELGATVASQSKALADVRHRVRPPGAALRDFMHRTIHRIKDRKHL